MRLRARLLALMWVGLVFLCLGGAHARAADDLHVLILSGQNNHNWRKTTPALKDIYEASGRFTVEVTEHPEDCDAETFEQCDAVVSNWSAWPEVEARPWGSDTEQAFMDYVEDGGGFVLFHAASATLKSWPEFQSLIGATWGENTGHGRVSSFEVEITDDDHPITDGVHDFQITDELWHRMAVRDDVRALCHAYSNPSTGGSGRDEPVAFVNHKGDGRCFHLVLGHDVQAMRSPGWKTLMLRGTEWAATGAVTIPVSEELKEGPEKPSDAEIEEALRSARDYRWGDRIAVQPLRKIAHHSAAYPEVQKKLAAGMADMLDGDATADCKKELCRLLAFVGSAEQVPALVDLLGDEDLTFAARDALERIEGEQVEAAMRKALGGASGETLIGLIHSLGRRGDEQAVKAVSGHLEDSNPAVAGAAVRALGQIGTGAAEKALRRAADDLAQEVLPVLDDALLNRAEKLLAGGKRDAAAQIYAELFKADRPAHVRVAALPGLLSCRPDRTPEILKQSLESDSRALSRAAVHYVRTQASARAAEALAARLGEFAPDVQARLLEAFAAQGREAVLPAVKNSVDGEHTVVRRAALAALGELGDAGTVPLLVDELEGASEEELSVIRESLRELSGDSVNEVLIRETKEADSTVRAELIDALADRGAKSAVPVLLDSVAQGGEEVRRAAFRALGKLAAGDRLPELIELLLRARESELDAARQAVRQVAQRSDHPSEAVQFLVGALDRAEDPARCALLQVLPVLGGLDALSAVRQSLEEGSGPVREAALRAMAAWPEASPLQDMLDVARETSATREKLLALRGIAEVITGPDGLPMERKLSMLSEALKLAERAQEKRMLLSALEKFKTAEALQLAQTQLGQPEVAREAAMTVVQIAGAIWESDKRAAASALQDVLRQCEDPSVRNEAALRFLDAANPANLALKGTASSPDDLEKDGAAGGDAAGIDGNEGTYWDEVNGRELYRYRVTWEEPHEVSLISIRGYQHHNYAPRDFQVLCDGEVVAEVQGAEYTNNRLAVGFDPVRCESLELKIAGYYGGSPAIRELGIYHYDVMDSARQPSYHWRRTVDSLALMNRGRVVWQANFAGDAGKPYFHPVCLPDGTKLTWLRPPDHPWHRGLWFSWKYINGLNYWEEDRDTHLSEGRTEVTAVSVETEPDFSTTIEMKISYHPPEKDPVLTETRVVEVSKPDEDGSYTMDWKSTFKAQQEVELGRTPPPHEEGGKSWGGYAGLSCRIAEQTTGWKVLDSEDRRGLEPHGKEALWADFSLVSRETGRTAGVAIFGHPDNPRHPTPWFVIMDTSVPFGYLSPALLWDEPMTLHPEEEMTLRYRVLIHPERMEPEALEEEWKSFSTTY